MNWEVIIDKPMKVREYCIWDERMVTVTKDKTTAIITAGNELVLQAKLKKLYPNDRIISYKRVN